MSIIEITPSKQEELRQKRLEAIKNMTMEFQLGAYVGELIVREYLPTLEVDMLHTKNVIGVEPAEKAKATRLRDIWFKRTQQKKDSTVEWKKLREYHEMLENKYLPSFLECRIDPVNVVDETEFKRGIAHSIWHSDLSHFNCSGPEDISIRLESEARFTVITLKRTTADTVS